MLISIIRDIYSPQSTLGKLALDGVFQCFTLEEPEGDSSGLAPYCIKAGTYRGKMGWSNHFQRVVPHILDVPNRTWIEIHIGDFPGDTKGCVLVGQQRGFNVLHLSEPAWVALVAKLPLEFAVEIIDTRDPEIT
jgi:hypothetical protein